MSSSSCSQEFLRGALIVFEGCDGVGKSTMIEQVSSKMECKVFKFPDFSTPCGQLIKEVLEKGNPQNLNIFALHHLFTANRWELQDSLLAAIDQNIPVIVDRYSDSGIAYTTAKYALEMGFTQEQILRMIEMCKKWETGLLKPDQVIFLTHDKPVFKKEKRNAYDDAEFNEKVSKVYVSSLDCETIVVDNTKYDKLEEVIGHIFITSNFVNFCDKTLRKYK